MGLDIDIFINHWYKLVIPFQKYTDKGIASTHV